MDEDVLDVDYGSLILGELESQSRQLDTLVEYSRQLELQNQKLESINQVLSVILCFLLSFVVVVLLRGCYRFFSSFF